ncbi:MAG: carbamate kinase [Candidatus Bathyarchaeota archaeon]|nr:carbamate kinase [Candidatus Bathyarchaeota archaeon]MDH5746025.1 carbamate kinase [Candidatus Bathyarchaeota archaeon]
MAKIAVVAIGGNSLIKDQEHQTVPDQFEAIRETCRHIASMLERGWNVVITHGNGPQVGFSLLRSELTSHVLHTVPLDSCVADTQGTIGYMIQQCLCNEFKRRGIKKQAVTVVTQVLVDKNDPDFQNPTKPIGPFYDEDKAQRYRKERGWNVKEDSGRGWRRAVPSPIPVRIIELDAAKTLVDLGFVTVVVGGGGIPVIEEDGELSGIEAVIDKDYASSLLAIGIKADLFLISTSVEKVALNFGKPNQKLLDRMTLEEAKKYYEEGHFPPGSMGPKIQAIINFLERGGKEAIITDPENIERALLGETGTRILL